MSGRVAGKVIVVTGAASGQGAAETARLTAEGATVIAADLSASDGPTSRMLDVADPDSWVALRDWMEAQFARVDGLINNAGTTSRVRLPDVDIEEWNRTLAVNLTGPMLGITTLLPLMGAGASIVNVGSIAGLTAHYTAAYTASKWGCGGSPTPPRWSSGRAGSASTPSTPDTSTPR